MSKLRVHAVSVSLDGYAAGPSQSLDNPLGVGGMELHQWVFPTRTAQQVIFGGEGGTTGVDDDFVARGFEGIGATIMGRNMFGPVRGDWAGSDWNGWWGDEPSFHHPVFVLTHHAREPLELTGTTFTFVTDGIESALEQARAAAGPLDIRLGGGASTVQQYLRAGLVDELHIAIVPILLGGGERLLDGLADVAHLYERTEMVATDAATHMVLARR